MRVLLTRSPPHSTAGTTSTSTPRAAQRVFSIGTSPAASRPNRKSSPQQTTAAPSRRTSTSSTNSSGGISEKSVKSGVSSSRTPHFSSMRAFFVSVMSSQLSHLRAGCPLWIVKVKTPGTSPASPARSTARPITAACPMCSPSKKPQATAERPAGAASAIV